LDSKRFHIVQSMYFKSSQTLLKVNIKTQWSIKTTFNKAVKASAESVILETQHRINTTIRSVHTGSFFHSVGRLCFNINEPSLQQDDGKMQTSDPNLDVPLGVGRRLLTVTTYEIIVNGADVATDFPLSCLKLVEATPHCADHRCVVAQKKMGCV